MTMPRLHWKVIFIFAVIGWKVTRSFLETVISLKLFLINFGSEI